MGDKLRHDEAILSPLAAARRVSVTRLTDLPRDQVKCLAKLECQDVETRPWVTGPALSIPPAVALGVLMRRRATTNRAGTALAAGPSSTARGAFVSAFACPSDDPLLHSTVVHGRLLDRDDSGTGRSAPPVAMVRKDHRSGGFDADEACQCVT
jgi:hypothetical protein